MMGQEKQKRQLHCWNRRFLEQQNPILKFPPRPIPSLATARAISNIDQTVTVFLCMTSWAKRLTESHMAAIFT
jgi:hypothetical protein